MMGLGTAVETYWEAGRNLSDWQEEKEEELWLIRQNVI